MTINALIVLNLLADTAVHEVKNKIDVTVRFNQDIREEQVVNVQNYLLSVQGVKEVEYVSKEDSLIDFRAKHSDDPQILESLQELGDNPFGATLIIRAQDADQYQEIITALESEQYKNLIKDKNFDDHRTFIDRVNTISDRVQFSVMVMAIAFALISILIVFNTIRVAIYSHRDEIRVMTLVGATDGFVVAPYIVQGFLYALLSVALTALVLYPLLAILQPYLTIFFETGVTDLIGYYNQHAVVIFGTQFLVSAALNIFSAILASTRYLKQG